MTYNYNLSNLRGLCIFFILYIHTISFLIDYDSLNFIQQYFYSLSSLCVPLLFMLSGYLYYFSNNQVKRTISLIYKYLIFALVTYIINLLIIKTHSHIIYLVTFNASSLGYLWFIKILIYLQLFVITLRYERKLIIVLLLMIIGSFKNSDPSEIIYYSVCYYIAFLIAKYQQQLCKYMPRSLVIVVFVLPVLLNELYFSYRFEIVLFVAIIFIFILQIKSNYEIKLFRLFSNYSLEFLFFQYFVIELITAWELTFHNFYVPFIIFTSLTTVAVYIYAIINKKFKEELSNI